MKLDEMMITKLFFVAGYIAVIFVWYSALFRGKAKKYADDIVEFHVKHTPWWISWWTELTCTPLTIKIFLTYALLFCTVAVVAFLLTGR